MVHVIVEDKRDHGGTLWFSVLVDVGIQRTCAIGVQADASVVEIWRRPPYAFHLLRLVRERGKFVLVLQTHRLAYNLFALGSRTTGTTSFQSCRFNPFLSG